jgi:hypothetical protein
VDDAPARSGANAAGVRPGREDVTGSLARELAEKLIAIDESPAFYAPDALGEIGLLLGRQLKTLVVCARTVTVEPSLRDARSDSILPATLPVTNFIADLTAESTALDVAFCRCSWRPI